MGAMQSALAVLKAATTNDKYNAVCDLADRWQLRRDIGTPISSPPDTPGRPESPNLVPPAEVSRRRLGSKSGRAALLHAVAHIEFNAIDLAADMIVRFGHHSYIPDELRSDFIGDWISVCHDEARHFMMIETRLENLQSSYGAFPAHNGLWEAAVATKHNFAARLAIAPMVLEARGLDVTPAIIEKLKKNEDLESAEILKTIYNDEIGHVAIGAKWFRIFAELKHKNPESYFHELVGTYYAGKLKPPFNVQARTLAGLKQGFYMPLI